MVSQFKGCCKIIVVSQMTKIEKKKPGPKPTGRGEQVNVRLLPDLLSAVDKHQAAMGAESRAAAIRQVLTDFFKRKGLL